MITTNNRPKYLEIADEIEESIRKGKLETGSFLAASTALAKDYQVTRFTVKRALDLLEQKDLLSPVIDKRRKVIFGTKKAINDVPTVAVIEHEENLRNVKENTVHLRLYEQMVYEFHRNNINLVKILLAEDDKKIPETINFDDLKACILFTDKIKPLIKSTGKPFISMQYNYCVKPDNLIFPDGKTVMFEAIDYLYGKGHRNLLFLEIKTIAPYPLNDDMWIGYQRGCEIKKLKTAERVQLDWMLRFDHEKFARFLKKLLKKYPKTDSIILGTNEMGAVILTVLSRLGIKVPEDISVLAIGGGADSNSLIPTLTTFENDYEAWAQFLYRQTRNLLEYNEKIPQITYAYTFKLTERQSVMKRKS